MSVPKTFAELVGYEDGDTIRFTTGDHAGKEGRVNHVGKRLVIEEIGDDISKSTDITSDTFADHFGKPGGRRKTKRRSMRKKRTIKRLPKRK